MATEVYASLDALPPGLLALLDGSDGVFSTAAWYRAVLGHALPADGLASFVAWRGDGDGGGVGGGGAGTAVVPLLQRAGGLWGLTTPYTCLYRPCASAEMDGGRWRELGRALGGIARRHAFLRLDALDADADWLPELAAGLRSRGLFVRVFDGFGNWNQPVAGLDWAAYLAGRPGPLRETLRRKGRRAATTLRFELVAGTELDRAIAAYTEVYARSWKQTEPFAAFPAAMIRALAAIGALRLGLCWNGDTPVAAQIWSLEHGRATVHKLAHDEAHRGDSPGTLLTAAVLRPMFDEGTLSALDFGRGDDPYKRDWVSERRQRVGLLALNPRNARGLAMIAREMLGAARRKRRSVQFERGAGEHDPQPR